MKKATQPFVQGTKGSGQSKELTKLFMGVGGEKKPMHEIAATRAAGRAAAFDELIERIKSSGGVISKDETSPLYVEVGMQEFEVGSQRIVEFILNNIDFQLIRKTESAVLQGSGHQKHVEEIEIPRTHDVLKKRDEHGQWQVMDLDLEDMV